jgi:hypothetical protein
MSHHGRVVAITGAGRGIGLTTARLLLARGAKVALGDLDAALAAAGAAGHDGRAIGLPLDVADRASFAAFLAEAERALGPVDVLVNNAGIMPIGPFLDESDELTRRQVDVNVHGVITGMKLALPGMVARGRGHVVNLGSAASMVGLAGEAVYCGTKFAVLGLTEAVREELRGTGVELTVVMPNLVATDLGSGMTAARGSKTLTPDAVAEAILGAIERPRLEVPVPAALGPQLRLRRLLPVRARDAITRALRMDEIATKPDPAARAAYERRVAQEAQRADQAHAA